MYLITPTANDLNTPVTFKYIGIRQVNSPRYISSSYFDYGTKSFIYGDGQAIYNSTIRIVTSPSSGKLMGVEILGPNLLITLAHTSFS